MTKRGHLAFHQIPGKSQQIFPNTESNKSQGPAAWVCKCAGKGGYETRPEQAKQRESEELRLGRADRTQSAEGKTLDGFFIQGEASQTFERHCSWLLGCDCQPGGSCRNPGQKKLGKNACQGQTSQRAPASPTSVSLSSTPHRGPFLSTCKMEKRGKATWPGAIWCSS